MTWKVEMRGGGEPPSDDLLVELCARLPGLSLATILAGGTTVQVFPPAVCGWRAGDEAESCGEVFPTSRDYLGHVREHKEAAREAEREARNFLKDVKPAP